MRKESKNWKLINDSGLFEFPENEEYLNTFNTGQELIKCEDCGSAIKMKEEWKAFLRSSRVRKSSVGENFIIRAAVEFYCQNCSIQ